MIRIVLGLILAGATLFPTLPLFPCGVCFEKRKDVRDWLKDPTVETYRREHRETVAAAEADLQRIDDDCDWCFHGRICFLRKIGVLTRRH
ncbi:MAG TPA: hypothetical protein VM222_01900 [Planctomycetota bacterium]|nr:hypothetical protein [Planctomycetota bacterium]